MGNTASGGSSGGSSGHESGSNEIKNSEHRQQMERIVKGQIGPSNLTKEEAITMFHTIENRMEHKDIKSDIYNKNQYHTLKHQNQDYKLSSQKQQIINSAWNEKDTTKNEGKLGWDTSETSIKSNKYYEWKADDHKTGAHYYYDAKKK